MTSIETVMSRIVDYAGLFPPAGLELEPVVRNYASYVESAAAPMLGRLIVPAGRLGDFENVVETLEQQQVSIAGRPWLISSLLPPLNTPDGKFSAAVEAIGSFNQRQQSGRRAIVDTIEVKVVQPDEIRPTVEAIPASISKFLEIPHATDPARFLDEIRQMREAGRSDVFAKIRTGGVTPDLIPTVEEVARFIHRCAQRRVGLKATAGLHHPLRREYPLTYEANAPRSTMHGFLNVFAAIAFAFEADCDESELVELLQETDLEKLQWQRDGVLWNGHQLSNEQIVRVRESYGISFGSCSFTEPLDDLCQLSLIDDLAVNDASGSAS